MKKILILLALFLTVKTQAQVTFQSQLLAAYNMPTEQLSNIWGYTDAAGNQYALVGTCAGVSIVDINVKTAPVELFNIPYVSSPAWREIKTYGSYAYVTTDAGSSPAGLLIIDLTNLPASWDTTIYLDNLADIHALHIDEPNHRLYLYGSGAPAPSDGALIYDIIDPTHPVYLGKFDNGDYVHDGEVRNNILYAGHIYAGYASIVDVTNPLLPLVLGSIATPSLFTHNTWLSDDDKTMFTTDETDDSYLASYNINDPTNIIELDRYKLPIAETEGGIVHNVYVLNDYLIMSYYTHGFVVIDAHEPDMLTLIGQYDTSPLTGNSYNGDWGVFPFFNDSTVICSDMEQGLFVCHVNYHRAAYLKGLVTNSITGAPIMNTNVNITTTAISDISTLSGEYKMGIADAGTYTVTYAASGYFPKTITTTLVQGVIKIENVQLDPLVSVTGIGNVINSITNAPIANVNVTFTDGLNDFTATSNASGNFTISSFYLGTYNGYAGAWGYQTQQITGANFTASDSSITITLTPGYYDDFTLNTNWTVNTTASTGAWELGEPVGTIQASEQSNPDFDLAGDFGDQCYVTGNGGGSAPSDDVDNGYSSLVSPIFDLSSYNEPVLSFSSWFFNAGGTGTPNDTLKVFVSNGSTEVLLYQVKNADADEGSWTTHSFNLNNYLTCNSTMKLRVYVNDANPGHIVEAGFDGFSVVDSGTVGILQPIESTFNIMPNPATDFVICTQESAKSMQIIDGLGRVVINQTVNCNDKINIKHLAKGTYNMIITTKDNKRSGGKFVKN